MIVRLEQISRLPSRNHEIRQADSSLIGTGTVPDLFNGLMKIGRDTYAAITNNVARTELYQNESAIGWISQTVEVTKKILFLPIGFEYYIYNVLGKELRVYESGLGQDMHFFSVYENGVVVGVIHKDDLVKNYKNTYTLYAEADEMLLPLCLFTMFLESTAFCDRTGGLGNVTDNTPFYTAQKELQLKYDPNFIPHIIALEASRNPQ